MIVSCQNRINSDSHRLVHLGETAQMWNEVFLEHRQKFPECQGFLSWDIPSEERRGLVTRLGVFCDTCVYKSKKYSLYKEIGTKRKGRKPAKVNYGLQAGLSQTPIGNASLRKIILSTNTPAPSSTSLQSNSNKVLKQIETLNKKDMQKRRQNLIEINELRSASNPNVIGIQSDGMYNNPLYSGVGETPFQPATQTVYSIAENVTKKHQIISLVTKNKLCSRNQHLQSENESDHVCSSEICGANIPMEQNIGDELPWAKEGMTDLAKDNIQVGQVTTDPDSSAYRATEHLYEQGILENPAKHFIDMRHLSENMRKTIKKNQLLLRLMPKQTKTEKTKLLHNFSIDITDRCTAEFNKAYTEYAGNTIKIKNKLSYACDAIIGCYMGSHLLCKKHSLVCRGGIKNWVNRSAYLNNDFKIKASVANANLIRSCVHIRLSPSVLDKTILNTNTQKVESFNRVLRQSLPRNVTFSRNFSGRAHSAAHCSNNGPGDSLISLCTEIGAEIPQKGKVHHALKQMQNEQNLRKTYRETDKYKNHRVMKRKKLFKLHAKHQHEILYKKNMLDMNNTKDRAKASNKSHTEHNYAQQRVKSTKK